MTDAEIEEGLRICEAAKPRRYQWTQFPLGGARRYLITPHRAEFVAEINDGFPVCDFLTHAANNYAEALREIQRLREGLQGISTRGCDHGRGTCSTQEPNESFWCRSCIAARLLGEKT